MNKNWIKSSIRKPPQGKKVLCFTKGDLDVRQRFKNYWIPIPYVDSKCADIDEPELWQEIEFPSPYTGYMQVLVEGKELMNMDQFEKHCPEEFNEMVESMVKMFKEKK